MQKILAIDAIPNSELFGWSHYPIDNWLLLTLTIFSMKSVTISRNWTTPLLARHYRYTYLISSAKTRQQFVQLCPPHTDPNIPRCGGFALAETSSLEWNNSNLLDKASRLLWMTRGVRTQGTEMSSVLFNVNRYIGRGAIWDKLYSEWPADMLDELTKTGDAHAPILGISLAHLHYRLVWMFYPR